MPSETGDPRGRQNVYARIVAIVLLLVQAVVVSTPLAEGRSGPGARQHVEARNEQRHYAHAEANCAFCAVRSIHAPAATAPARSARSVVLHRGVRAVLLLLPSTDFPLPHLSRAPPALS
jgi:hypothetical protein